MPVVCRFLKLSLPAILAVGLACATSPARAQDAHDTPFNAYYSGTIATGDASGPMVPELASGWGGGWFFGDSTAMFRDLLDTSTAPGTFGNGLWIIFQAGGNAILGDYAGERSLPDDNGTSSISGTYTVTEGWGLFEGTVGHGTFTGTVNVLTGNWTISLEGMLSPAL